MNGMCATQKPLNGGRQIGNNRLLPKRTASMVGSGKQLVPERVGASTLVFKGPFCIGHKTLPKGKRILIGARIDALSSFQP
jgi:hypothetical protein